MSDETRPIRAEVFTRAQRAELRNWSARARDAAFVRLELDEPSEVAAPLRRIAVDTQFERGLEVGIGPFGLGWLAVHFANRVKQVDGVDPLPRLAIRVDDPELQSRVDEIRRHVNYTEARAEALPAAAATYDIVSCVNVVDQAQDPERILREMDRVLKPGGLLVFGVRTLSTLGEWKWRLLRTLHPRAWQFAARPQAFSWERAQTLVDSTPGETLWQNRPDDLRRMAGHRHLSFWIRRKPAPGDETWMVEPMRQGLGLPRLWLKWRLFPGINLHARLRGRLLPPLFAPPPAGGEGLVLDAGCGNGLLTHQAYLKGNRAIGISIKEPEVTRCRELFNGYLGIPQSRLRFLVRNIYDIADLKKPFDQIICSEVLEHLSRDAEAIALFHRVLKPGGILHLCVPNADHPDNVAHGIDHHESGGHVRPGYTLAALRALLEPAGFRIGTTFGLGGPIRQAFNKRVLLADKSGWRLIASAISTVSHLFLWLDAKAPRMPMSIYVQAQKPA